MKANSTAEKIRQDLKELADESKARVLQRYFKTGPGEYGEGDVFLGVTVPQSRKIAKLHFHSAGLSDVEELLRSKVHEERLVALLVLVHRYEAGEKGIARFYLDHLRHVNNWDLVDLSAPNILGAHLAGKSRSLLYRLAKSANIWEKRVAIVATYYFIRRDEFDDTLRIAELLINDRVQHDLIHKATGWMLREVGKRNISVLLSFLDAHFSEMPRTMLRYAIEKLPARNRNFYLARESR
jgi:3-methyladenine DNA glycosylase AlkD